MVVTLVFVVIIYGRIDRNLFDPLFQMLDVIQLRNVLKYTNKDLLVYVFCFFRIFCIRACIDPLSFPCKGRIAPFCDLASLRRQRASRFLDSGMQSYKVSELSCASKSFYLEYLFIL